MHNHIENINSQGAISAAQEQSLLKRTDFLLDCFWRTPFYLVDPGTMDVLYPPEKRRLFDEDCVAKVLTKERESAEQNKDRNPFEEAERLLGEFSECRREIEGRMIAVGVYKAALSPREVAFLKKSSRRELPNVPSIFVCSERVAEWADKVGTPGRQKGPLRHLLFEAIALHELAHAFMDGVGRPARRSDATRIIEESLANAIAFAHFAAGEKPWVSRCFAEQPMEYRAYPFWTLRGEGVVRDTAINWRLKGNVFYPFATWGSRGSRHWWFEFEHWMYAASTEPKYEARLALDLLGSVVRNRQP